MEQTERKTRSGYRNFVLGLGLLLLTNVLMSVILMSLSKKTLREQIDQRMLDIANTAAYQLDGDVLKTLTADDEGTAGYQQALETLRSFQDNIELDYIYGIRAESDGSFTFTIDPAVEDPGEFGSPIMTTEALQEAAKGKPCVDKKAYSDAWGRFYSAYSPVFDSDGNVAGIVGVDFNADWYDEKLSSHRAIAVTLTMIAMSAGIAISFVIMSQNRKRFSEMLKSMAALDREAQKLDQIIMQNSIKKLDMLPDSKNQLLKTLATGETNNAPAADEYAELNSTIDSVYKKLQKYLKYVDSEIYREASTGVGNKAAYKQKINAAGEAISSGSAAFSVAFFDINGIKKVYTNKGYEAGDKLLFECAGILKIVFGAGNVFHLIGDEFIVIADNKSQYEMEERFAKFEEDLKKYNSEQKADERISVAKGFVTFNAEKHKDYRQVFVEAKAACDQDKEEYYRRHAR